MSERSEQEGASPTPDNTKRQARAQAVDFNESIELTPHEHRVALEPGSVIHASLRPYLSGLFMRTGSGGWLSHSGVDGRHHFTSSDFVAIHAVFLGTRAPLMEQAMDAFGREHVVVDDEMVERALNEYLKPHRDSHGRLSLHVALRAALTAALTPAAKGTIGQETDRG